MILRNGSHNAYDDQEMRERLAEKRRKRNQPKYMILVVSAILILLVIFVWNYLN